MTIIGCDYSTKFINFGWNFGGWQWPRIKVEEDLGELLFNIKHVLPEPLEDGHLWMERPWSGYNQWTGMQMQRIATIVDVIATQRGYDTHWVAIPTWRATIFGKGKYDKKTAKGLAIAKAKELTGQDLDDNAADALCLCLYGIGEASANKAT